MEKANSVEHMAIFGYACEFQGCKHVVFPIKRCNYVKPICFGFTGGCFTQSYFSADLDSIFAAIGFSYRNISLESSEVVDTASNPFICLY